MAALACEIRCDMNHEPLAAELAKLRAWLVERPDEVGKVDYLFFRDDKIRPGLIRIVQIPAARAGELALRVDLSDQGRELVRALVAGEFDGRVVQEASHGSFLSES